MIWIFNNWMKIKNEHLEQFELYYAKKAPTYQTGYNENFSNQNW